MYLGRNQLGTTVYLHLICRDANGTPTLPDAAPQVKVQNASGVVLNKLMPILDRYTQAGLFHFPLFLNGDFSTGQWEALYFFRIGGYYGIERDNFEIVAGGNADGEITNMAFYHRPHADFIVQSLQSGKIVQKRNPKV